jgi:ParB family chromosome partitioning protein
MADAKRKMGLGRGLSALLDDPAVRSSAVVLPVASITPNPDQPRRHFDEAAMAELAASIRQHGVLQPILVRPIDGARHQIIAGERRWRATQAAGLHEIPVIIRPLSDAAVAEIALIENIQRSDLNAIEEASGYQRLIREFGHTQAALAGIVGKSRSHVTNLLRLLDLPPAVQQLVENGALSMGHARALAGAEDAEALAAQVVRQGLSVRALEQRLARARPSPPRPATPAPTDANSDALELQLAEALGMPVALQVAGSGHSGSLTIRFADLDQLDLLCARLGRA